MPIVLVVDDQPLVRAGVAMALEGAGFAVVEVGSTDAAIDALAGGGVSAVAAAAHAKGTMNGVGLAKWLRDRAPRVPVILVSGFPVRPDLRAIDLAIPIVPKKPRFPDKVASWVTLLVGMNGAERVHLVVEAGKRREIAESVPSGWKSGADTAPPLQHRLADRLTEHRAAPPRMA